MSPRSARRGFSLLEVIVALGILVTSLVLLLEIQMSAAIATREAERIVTATQLAQEKLVEIQTSIEKEGITQAEEKEEGDFSDFGDEEFDLEFGENLDEYHYEWTISEIDIGLAGDIATMAQDLQSQGLLGGLPSEEASGATGMQDQAPDLNSLGISNEMITEMLSGYIREVRVRVWWGEDGEEAEAQGNEVIITSHVTDPGGSFTSLTGEAAQETP